MRKLTDHEIEREVASIKTRRWPYNSMLMMKNIYDHRTGAIFRDWDGGPETIVPTIVERAKEGQLDPETKYANLTELVTAGWIVD